MGDTAKWLRALRNQRKEHQVELNQVRLEYEALLLQEKKKNKWLSDKLIETQKKLRVKDMILTEKEIENAQIRRNLRDVAQLGRSVKKTEAGTPHDAESTC